MNNLSDIVITDVDCPVTVQLDKGYHFQMKNRATFGLSLCVSGQVTFHMNGKHFVSSPDSVMLLPQGSTYSLNCNKEGIFPVINFKCDNLDCKEIISIPIKNPISCVKEYEMLKTLFLNGANHFAIMSSFYKLLDEIFPGNIKVPNRLQKISEYIEKNLSNPGISNTSLAREMGISEIYLRKLFIKYYQITPKQFVLDLRLRKARQLLTETGFSVAQIAEDCGFSSLYHFCRIFKEKTGLTPTEYSQRNQIRQI